MGFRLNPKWVFPVQFHFLTHSNSNSNSRFHSSVRRVGACFGSPRFPSLPLTSEESLVFLKDPLGACNSTFLGTIENEYSIIEDRKGNVGRRSPNTSDIVNEVTNARELDDKSSPTTHTASKKSSFSLLLDSLGALEETFVDLGAVRLEEDIKFQLGRLGALELFNIFLSRTLRSSSLINSSDVVAHHEDSNSNVSMDTHLPRSEVFIRSTRKNERKRRREVENPNADSAPLPPPPRSSQRRLKHSTVSSMKRSSRSRYRRSITVKNEVEMAKGVKMLASLERVRETLEKETGRVLSLCCWAEAAGVDEKMLRQNLHFAWHCRDALLRSTRSLVLFLARNYRGLGIANEDLLQAGNLGVLQGAERFDHTRGYRFSTYVQYWIRKSMSRLVAQHARGVKIPCTLSRAINKIQKAQKTLSYLHGKHPDEIEIAKSTGLSLAKIRSADMCLRVVGSIDQKIGDSICAKYLEFMPDMSIESPEDFVLKQHLKREIDNMLAGLECRERQVIVLRYGLKDLQPKSLDEIGRLVKVSKEWVRKIEKKAMTKLKSNEKCASLKHFSVL